MNNIEKIIFHACKIYKYKRNLPTNIVISLPSTYDISNICYFLSQFFCFDECVRIEKIIYNYYKEKIVQAIELTLKKDNLYTWLITEYNKHEHTMFSTIEEILNYIDRNKNFRILVLAFNIFQILANCHIICNAKIIEGNVHIYRKVGQLELF